MLERYPANSCFSGHQKEWDGPGMAYRMHNQRTFLGNTRGQHELSTQSKDQIESAWLSYNTKLTWFFLSQSLRLCLLFVFVIQHIVCLTVILPNAY